MLFALWCHDKAGHEAVRLANRPAHVAYLEAQGERLVAAGPLLCDDGEQMIGSLLVLECTDRRAAEAFAAEDPYAQAGLFAAVEIRPWRRVFPRA